MQGKPGIFERIRFSRGLSLWQAIARGVEVITAVAIFVLLGDTLAAAEAFSPLALFLAALLVVINGIGYAELAAGAPRRGGAYMLVSDRLGGGVLAFLCGWALFLCTAGLGALLARGAADYLSGLLSHTLGSTIPTVWLGLGCIVLVALVQGIGGRGDRVLSLALPLVALLLVLTLLGIPCIRSGNYVSPRPQLGLAVTTLAAAFVGLEIVAARQAELDRRAVTFARALLVTSAAVTVIGAAVFVVALGVVGRAAGPITVAALGGAVLGVGGRITVLAVGAIVMLFSLGRALSTTVRRTYLLSRDGFWPTWLSKAQTRRGVPVRLLLLTTLLTIALVWLPGRILALVTGLLYVVVLMVVNLTLILRPRGKVRRDSAADEDAGKGEGRELLPGFYPWSAGLTLAIDALMIPLWGWLPVVCVAGCLAVGLLLYLSYGRSRRLEAQEGVIVFRPGEEHPQVPFRVLVPVANPATAGGLLRAAGRLAQLQGGDVLALHVVVVADSLPLEAGRRRARSAWTRLEKALTEVKRDGLPIETMTRVSRSVAQGVAETAAEADVDLILLGWGVPSFARGGSPGPVVDAVLRDAPCDVLVLRHGDIGSVKKILVPVAGGPHARVAARLALLLAEAYGAVVTLLYVQPGPATDRHMEENRRRLTQMVEGLGLPRQPEQKVVLAAGVVEGIVREAREYDWVILGVSEESLLDRFVFGSIPLQVAASVPRAALVQASQGLTGLWARRLIRGIRDTVPTLSLEDQLEVQQQMGRDAQPGINYFAMIVLSCVIAALGLLLDSPAVVIGAMLVAPLMSPIMAFSLGVVTGELRLIRRSSEAILKGIALAVVIAAFIALLSPLKVVTGEMLARSRPTLLDLGVALASGMAGAYALARKDVSAALPGVAIAAALMPPLATVGLSLALGDIQVAGGALLLFLTNIAAISLSGGVVFVILGIRPQVWEAESRRLLRRRLIASGVLLAIITIPLGFIMAGVVRDAAHERVTRQILSEHIVGGEQHLMALEIEQRQGSLLVVATVRSTRQIDPAEVARMEAELSASLGRQVRLELVVLPIVRSQGP